jgi:hypothetical protein
MAPQVEDRLAVREEEAAFLVVHDMVRVYNRRLVLRSAGPPTPPGNSLTSYHPDPG